MKHLHRAACAVGAVLLLARALRFGPRASAAAAGAALAGFVVLVGMLTLLPAVTTDMYLPSLPEVGRAPAAA